MKEIETLVEEKTKESLDVSRLTREGERMGSGPLWPSWGQKGQGPHVSWTAPMRGQPRELSRHGSQSGTLFLTHPRDFCLQR